VKVADVTNDHIRLSGAAFKAGPILIVIGVVLLALSVLIGFGDGEVATTFWKSYLVGWMAATGLQLGALFFILLQHLTRAGWSVSTRRLAEGIARNFNWTWILFLPIIILVMSGKGELLYQWGNQELMQHDHMLQAKAGYLSPTFWSIRAMFFLLVWAILGTLYFRWSTLQDQDGDVKWTHKMQKWAPIGMILYAMTQSFAAIDWMMTMQPKWFSTMFPVYFFAATLAGFFAFIILLARFLQRTGHVRRSITVEHYHDLGKLLFAFGIVFWAYIAFSQYMLIWYANIPVETSWYMTRQLGGWAPVSLLLLFGHFALPFVLMISRWTKRWRGTLPIIAGWMLLMFFVDMYWLVMPVVPETALAEATSYVQLSQWVASGEVSVGFGLHILNVTCLVGMVSLLCGGTLLNLRSCNLIAIADPRLYEALEFENV
jgi:hypothetical protein